MKKLLLILLILLLLAGCTKNEAYDYKSDFHRINSAEKIDNGILYYKNEDVVYDKNDKETTIGKDVKDLWRENDNLYYISKDHLYKYSFNTQKSTNIADDPHYILGKYNNKIISYYGRSIYATDDSGRTKLFKDGYYLNNAILYKNKVYGIPATNTYEYDLDTLKYKKVSTDKHDMSGVNKIGDTYYMITQKYKDKTNTKVDYTFYKITDDGPKEEFKLNDIYHMSDIKAYNGGMFITTESDSDTSTKGDTLLYVKDGKTSVVDKDYSYNLIGLYDNKLLYYKNDSPYGSENKNMTTFYLYDGKNTTKAFDLDVRYFEDISGFEYDGGVIIDVMYESEDCLYKYDGKDIKEIKTPYLYNVASLDVIDNKAYIRYTDGEESFDILNTIVKLD